MNKAQSAIITLLHSHWDLHTVISMKLIKLQFQGPSPAWAPVNVGSYERCRVLYVASGRQVAHRNLSGSAFLVNCLKRLQKKKILNCQSSRHLLWILPSVFISTNTYNYFCIRNKDETSDLISLLWFTYFSITGSLVQADLFQVFSGNSDLSISHQIFIEQKQQSTDLLEWSRCLAHSTVWYPGRHITLT